MIFLRVRSTSFFSWTGVYFMAFPFVVVDNWPKKNAYLMAAATMGRRLCLDVPHRRWQGALSV